MWSVRFTVVAVLGLPLAGCFPLPPKELPPWAMSPQAANLGGQSVGTARGPRRSRTVEAEHIWPASEPREIKPFSPEWQAREDALDKQLRRTMSICGNC